MNTTNSRKGSIEKREKFVVLDRDGVLNKDPGYVHKLEDFELYPDVIEGLNLLKNNFKFIIITNQSGIGRGYFKKEHMHEFNNHMLNELKKHGIKIEKVYFCPHTPEENCNCRKPNITFIKQAEKKFNINLKESFVIGDHPSDIELGKNTNCKTIYLLTGHGKKHKEAIKNTPDFTANNLLEAAKWILK